MIKNFLQRSNKRIRQVGLRSLMVCLCLALSGLSAWGQDGTYTFSGGTGVKDDPYLISTVEDLKNMAEAVNQGTASSTYNEKHYKLTKDLTLTPEDVDSWEPIGPIQYFFTGSFDGDGHTISGFNVTHEITSDRDIFGFFGHIENDAIIQNFNLVGDVEIKKTATDNYQYPVHSFGGICAEMDGASIINCTFNGKLNVEISVGSTLPKGIAGICGKVDNKGGYITNCSNFSEIIISMENISNTRDLPIAFGGIIGYSSTGLSILNCYNTGNIKVNMVKNNIMGVFLGGISGQVDNWADYVKIGYCYNVGNITVSGSNNKLNAVVGGIFGSGNISEGNCFNIGNINIEDIIVDNNGTYALLTGGIVGNLTNMSLSNCYNYGNIQTNAIKGNVYSTMFSSSEVSIESCYYLLPGIGDEANDKGKVDGMSIDNFKAGKVAWLLRQLNEDDGSYVFGQNLNVTPSDEYPTLRCFDGTLPAVYQLTLHEDASTTELIYRNSTNLNLPNAGDNFGWFDSDGKEYTNTSIIDKDVELWAKGGYKITIGTIENGTITIDPNQTLYQEGTAITVKTNPNSGYQLKAGSLQYSYVENGETKTVPIENGSFTMPAADVTISATFEPIQYQVTIADDIQHGKVVANPQIAAAGSEINLTVTPEIGYQINELYYKIESSEEAVPISNNSFEMPAADVTVYASFAEKDEPSEPVNPPVDPINYYNIYDETTYDFIDVSFSRNVVREGGSVNVHLEIPEGLDPAAVTLMYKRGMYGTWGALNLNDDNQYQINNIWTDIYVKAVVDESFIDPNPDENHIYIDLSETNDSIWLYTDHQLVEEGKTAVIQAEVAKSCQNKEIRYMYKRTVLGEWKEMPKDYSINQYVVRDITTDIYVKAYFVFDKQDPTTAKNPHHVYADITATSEGLYLDATRHKVADEGDTKVFLYVKKGFETKDARYLFKRGLKGEWEDLVPGIEQNTFEVTNIEEDIYLKGIDAIYTGTEGVDGVIRVYTKDGSLYVYTAQPEEISVISMTGVTVKRTQQTGLQSYPLNQGIYVVLVGEQVFKVRVK